MAIKLVYPFCTNDKRLLFPKVVCSIYKKLLRHALSVKIIACEKNSMFISIALYWEILFLIGWFCCNETKKLLNRID